MLMIGISEHYKQLHTVHAFGIDFKQTHLSTVVIQ